MIIPAEIISDTITMAMNRKVKDNFDNTLDLYKENVKASIPITQYVIDEIG
jgi:hypothetical protein